MPRAISIIGVLGKDYCELLPERIIMSAFGVGSSFAPCQAFLG